MSGDECRKASIKPEIRTRYDTKDTGNGGLRAQKEVRHRPGGAALRKLPLPDPAGQPERLMSNFGAIPVDFSNEKFARVVVLPVPYDETSTWLKGADKGPAAILPASANMELYDIETGSEVYRRGIFTAEPVTEKRTPEAMVAAVRERVSGCLEREQFVVTVGGEHSVAIGAVQAHAARYPDLCVLQLDAHADLRDAYEGSPFNHACVMARVREFCPIVQVGIRSMDTDERRNLPNGGVFWAHEMAETAGWIDAVVSRLGKHCYITIDLDVFDPYAHALHGHTRAGRAVLVRRHPAPAGGKPPLPYRRL